MQISNGQGHINRQRTDAYFQGQWSVSVGGKSRPFVPTGYSSSGLVQTPKSAIVSPHFNNTIVPRGSDCACRSVRGTNMYLCAACFFVVKWENAQFCLMEVKVSEYVCIPKHKVHSRGNKNNRNGKQEPGKVVQG